jgi:hypothetical protein
MMKGRLRLLKSESQPATQCFIQLVPLASHQFREWPKYRAEWNSASSHYPPDASRVLIGPI